MGKWYGEQHELTVPELNHILRMYHECEERECDHAFNEFECSGCPCYTALMALRSCDGLTKSRMREKNEWLSAEERRRKRERRRHAWAAALCSGILIAWAAFMLWVLRKSL